MSTELFIKFGMFPVDYGTLIDELKHFPIAKKIDGYETSGDVVYFDLYIKDARTLIEILQTKNNDFCKHILSHFRNLPESLGLFPKPEICQKCGTKLSLCRSWVSAFAIDDGPYKAGERKPYIDFEGFEELDCDIQLVGFHCKKCRKIYNIEVINEP